MVPKKTSKWKEFNIPALIMQWNDLPQEMKDKVIKEILSKSDNVEESK